MFPCVDPGRPYASAGRRGEAGSFASIGGIMHRAWIAWTAAGVSVIACGTSASTSSTNGEGGPPPSDGGADMLQVEASDGPAGDEQGADAEAVDASCTPLGACPCPDASACAACVPTQCGDAGAVCPFPENGTCDCGVVLQDNCSKPASHCLCPACGDGQGICVTTAQQAELCAGPFGPAFSCH
jgi:hypothetical protein